MVSADYFRVMGIPLLRGASRLARTRLASPEVIISAGLARRLWGNRTGRQRDGDRDGKNRSLVIGVVGDARNNDPAEEPTPAMYFLAPPALWSTMTVVVRTSGDELKVASCFGKKSRTGCNQPIFNVRSMEQG